MTWQRAAGCGQDDEPDNESEDDEEDKNLEIVGHVGDRQRVVHEVVEEHRREVRGIDIEVEILQGEFLRDDKGEDGDLECDEGEVDGEDDGEECPICSGGDCFCIINILSEISHTTPIFRCMFSLKCLLFFCLPILENQLLKKSRQPSYKSMNALMQGGIVWVTKVRCT